jgi:hypothetical protein
VKKLDPRSVSGVVLGMGPSTKQYRVLLADANKKAEVHIVRHIIVNARHFQEYFSRSDVVSEVQRCVAAYSCTPMPLAILAETIDVPMTATPTRALSRGSECADIQEIEEEVREQLLASQQDQYEADVEFDRIIDLSKCIRDTEPDLTRIGLDDYFELTHRRRQWLKFVNEVKVSHREGSVCINVMNTQSDTDAQSDAGTPVDGIVAELWHKQDVQLWTVDQDNPTCQQAVNGPNKEKWLEALASEVNSLRELDVFELVDRPKGHNVMKGKVVCKIKRDSLVHIEKFKCRYDGCGYSQKEGVDYFEHEVRAPTGQHATLRTLFVYAAKHKLQLRHIVESESYTLECSGEFWRAPDDAAEARAHPSAGRRGANLQRREGNSSEGLRESLVSLPGT